MSADRSAAPPSGGPPSPGGRRRRRSGGHLRRRGAHPPGRRPRRRRPDRPAADAVRPGPARHRTRPPEDARDPRHPAPHASTTRWSGSSATSTSARTSRWRSSASTSTPSSTPTAPPSTGTSGSRARTCPAASPPPTSSPGTPGTPTPTGPGSRPHWPACGRSSSSGSATSPWTSAGCSPGRGAELESTDMPQHVLDALAARAGRGGHRAGPPRSRPGHLHHPGAARARRARRRDGARRPAPTSSSTRPPRSGPPPIATSAGTSPSCAAGPTTCAEPGRIRLTLRFFRRPVRLLGEDRVTGVEVERTAVDGDGRAVGTGELEVLPADLVVRSVGYFGTSRCRACRWTSGRARCRTTGAGCCATGSSAAASTSAGWIKRGPSGVVGTNKHDARETVAALLADAADGTARRPRSGRRPGRRARRPRRRAGAARRLAGDRRRRDRPRRDAGAGRGRRCTSGRRCWPPSAPPPPAELRARSGGQQVASGLVAGGRDEPDARLRVRRAAAAAPRRA